jgi:hypothetical protein
LNSGAVTASWEEDDVLREYKNEIFDYCDGSAYIGEVNPDNNEPHGYGF